MNSEIFHDSICSEYKSEWKRSIIARKIPDAISSGEEDFTPNLTESFDLIAKICLEAELPEETEFSSYDSFENFYFNYLQQLKHGIDEHIHHLSRSTDTTVSSPSQQEMWEMARKLFRHDSLLCLLLIVSMAAKFYDARNPFDADAVRKFLQLCGEPKTLGEIFEHEFQMFRLMGFEVTTPAAYDAVQLLARNIYGRLAVPMRLEELKAAAVKFLRVVYLDKTTVYAPLKASLSDLTLFKRLLADQVLLGAGVVYAVIKLLNLPLAVCKAALSTLSDECQHEEFDIAILAKSILAAIN